MNTPLGVNFTYEEDGIRFRVYYIKNRVKVTALLGNKMVIEYANTPFEAAEKAKKGLINNNNSLRNKKRYY
jgi:calcineurin-like phosphoesterase